MCISRCNAMKLKYFVFFVSPFLSDGQDFRPNSSKGEVVNHSYYSLSYYEQHEQAAWVYYKLTPDMINGAFDRTDNFRSDPFVTTGSASLADYQGSGYDRGHLAPASDMKISSSAMSESFFLSNMSPQVPSFNRGGWKKLEILIRNWVCSEGEVFVITGPVFMDNLGTIGVNEITIPGYYYKIIYSERNKEMIGFVMPNEKISSDLHLYVRSVDFIEDQTDIDFFYQLADELEDKLESPKQTRHWIVATTSTPTTTQSNPFASSKNIQSSQCFGMAKSTGKQCKNKTKRSNGYCYIHQSQSSDYVKPKPTNYVGRCTATTKAGTQCKRNASSGSRYCWQHQ